MTVWRADYSVGGNHEVLPVLSHEFEVTGGKLSETELKKVLARHHNTIPERVYVFHFMKVTKL